MTRIIIPIFLTILFFQTSFSAQKMLYNTKSKKAIKYFEKALTCFNTIDPVSGKSDLTGAEEFLEKAFTKDF